MKHFLMISNRYYDSGFPIVRTILAALLLFLCSGAYTAQAPKIADNPNKKEQVNSATADQDIKEKLKSTADFKLPIESVITAINRPVDANCYTKCEEYKPEKDWWYKFSTDPIATFTGLLFIATVLLWWSTRCLVIGTEKTAQKQLRAYVFLDPVKEMTFVSKPSTSSTIEIEIHVKNVGLTPAHDVLCESWVTLDVWPLPSTFNFFDQKSVEPKSRHIIPPGGIKHYHTGSSRSLNDKELADVHNDKLRVYIYGRITYKDSFGNLYYTNFCHASTSLGKLGFKSAIALCDRHNDAN